MEIFPWPKSHWTSFMLPLALSKIDAAECPYSINNDETEKPLYDFILLDTPHSFGVLAVNALACSDSVIIPVQAQYLPAKRLELLLKTIARVRKQINHRLEIDGILITMVDNGTNDTKEIINLLKDTYGGRIKIFGHIPPLGSRFRNSKEG